MPPEGVTTRAQRISDTEGEYVYISQDKFDTLIQESEFLWHVHVHGQYYGTRKKTVDAALLGGTYIAILLMEAVEKLHLYATEKGFAKNVRSVYLHLEDEQELRRRLMQRADTSDIEERIIECRSWNEKARSAQVPLLILDAQSKKEELVLQALQYIS